jgi:hypothetical protein
MGQCAAAITDVKSAKEIVDELVTGAITALKSSMQLVARL